jgi:hypothetical protein
MDALAEGVEVERVAHDHHNLAIDHASLGQLSPDGFHEFGEVAREWSLVPRPELDAVAVAEDNASETIPLRLEPIVTRR